MKMTEIRAKNDAELARLVTETREKIAQAHIDLRTKEVKNVKEIHNLKQIIARALTVQSERELVELEEQNG